MDKYASILNFRKRTENNRSKLMQIILKRRIGKNTHLLKVCLLTIAYTDACGSKIINNDERTHFFRKIYLSIYSKRFRKGSERVTWERWVGYWTDCNILTPNSSVFSSTAFSFCWAAQSGVLRPQPSAGCWFSLQHLISNLSVAPGYIIEWHQPASCGRHICT